MPRRSHLALTGLFFHPKIVVFFSPVEIDGAFAHGLEGTLHTERADIDMPQNPRDEEHGEGGVSHLGQLHVKDVGPPVEREYQQIAGDGRDLLCTRRRDREQRLRSAQEVHARGQCEMNRSPDWQTRDMKGD